VYPDLALLRERREKALPGGLDEGVSPLTLGLLSRILKSGGLLRAMGKLQENRGNISIQIGLLLRGIRERKVY